MLATVFLLQWNRITFRTPLDILAESRGGGGARPGGGIPITTTSDRREAGHVMSTTTAADPRTGGMVSIMVMYRPPGTDNQSPGGETKTGDRPPTYDSLFLGENPPGYNMLTVNLPSSSHPVSTSSVETSITSSHSQVPERGEGEEEESQAQEGGTEEALVNTTEDQEASLSSVKTEITTTNETVRPGLTVE